MDERKGNEMVFSKLFPPIIIPIFTLFRTGKAMDVMTLLLLINNEFADVKADKLTAARL